MSSPPAKRPWYVLAALVFAWLFGVGGCMQGTAIIGSYWSPAPDVADVGARAKTDEDRAALKEAHSRCFVSTERAKGRIYPLGAASFVLGAALVLLAARSMAGRNTARALLVQVVLAQAAFVLFRDYSTRDVLAECLEYQRLEMRVDLLEHKRDPALVNSLDSITPELRVKATLAGGVLRGMVAGLIVLALTRRRALEYYAAMERLREGREGGA